jgi:hypothetical protein
MTTVPMLVGISVIGDAGRLDLGVSAWTSGDELARRYAADCACGPVELRGLDGRVLDGRHSLKELGIWRGAVVVAVPRADDAAAIGAPPVRLARPEDAPATDERVRVDRDRSLPARVATVCVASLLIGVLGVLHGGRSSATAAGAAIVLAVLSLALTGPGRPRRCAAWWLASVPLHVSVASAVLLTSGDPPWLMVVATAAMAAGAAATVFRTIAPGVADVPLTAWVVTGGAVAVVSAGCLLLAWPSSVAWALLAVLGILVMRVLPSWAVRVPDAVLIEVDRLAVTAWSARERTRPRARGLVRRGDVAAVADRGILLVGAGTAAAVLVSATAVTSLLVGHLSTAQTVGAHLTWLSAGTIMVLAGRARRETMVRRLQRVVGAVVLVGGTAWWLVAQGPEWQARIGASAVALGLVTVGVAVALGRGWSSVWWSRRAEQAETMAGIVLVAAMPLTTGLFDAVRGLTSS